MLFRCVIGLICMLGVMPLSAQAEQKYHSRHELDGASTTIKTLSLSRNLVDYGKRNHDALALILAADMRQKLALKPAQQALTNNENNPVSTGQKHQLEVSEILAVAEKFAADNETYLELIKDIRFATPKGKRGGPAYTIATINPGGIIHYKDFRFEIDKYAEIYVEGSGKTNLDLFVYDANGKLVCSDTDSSNINYCGWAPNSSGSFKIMIQNKGTKSSQYFLISN